MNRKIVQSTFFLSILFLINSLTVCAQETTFLNPKKNPKTVFVALDGKKAYVFEIYRIPDSQGFTGREVLDTMEQRGEGNYTGKNATLSTNGASRTLFLKSLHEQKDVTIEMVSSEGDNSDFNVSLNNALLNQFAVQLSNDVNTKFQNTTFFVGDVVNHFYSEEDVDMPYQQFESKYAKLYQDYADSTLKKHESYAKVVNQLKANQLAIPAEQFINGIKQLPERRDLTVTHFKILVNELAMTNPATFLKAAEMASPEVKKDMFEVLSGESRKNIVENGPDCETKDELKKQHRKKIWIDVGLIGLPSALIILAAFTINT